MKYCNRARFHFTVKTHVLDFPRQVSFSLYCTWTINLGEFAYAKLHASPSPLPHPFQNVEIPFFPAFEYLDAAVATMKSVFPTPDKFSARKTSGFFFSLFYFRSWSCSRERFSEKVEGITWEFWNNVVF